MKSYFRNYITVKQNFSSSFNIRKIIKASKTYKNLLSITWFLEATLQNKPEQAASNPNSRKYFGNRKEE